MSLFAYCPHCNETRMVRLDSLPSDTVTEPCDGCAEHDALLEHIAESEFHDDELYARENA